MKKNPKLAASTFRDRRGQSFGDRLRHLMARREALTGTPMTQRQLAEAVTAKLGLKADYAPQTVSGWLTGKWVPDTFTIAAVAKIFGCSPGWLAFGEDAGVPSPEAKERESLELEAAQRIVELVRRQASVGESSAPRVIASDSGAGARRRRRA